VDVVVGRPPLAGGRFRIIRLLGEGGMGVVYEAFDRVLRSPVASRVTSGANCR
jgi:serine/threonine protein kinase